MTQSVSTNAKVSKTHAYILLDRTGSMSSIWDEALGSVNAYVSALAAPDETGEKAPETEATLAVFDHHNGLQFDVLRRSVLATDWKKVDSGEASPRGMTPLFDAIAHIVALAETDKPEKAIIVIMTDGHENSSSEVTKQGAKAALERAKAKGWEVVFLGADFAKFADADAVGVGGSRTMAMSPGTFGATMETLARKSRSFLHAAAPSVEFGEQDREQAGEADVKRRKGS